MLGSSAGIACSAGPVSVAKLRGSHCNSPGSSPRRDVRRCREQPCICGDTTRRRNSQPAPSRSGFSKSDHAQRRPAKPRSKGYITRRDDTPMGDSSRSCTGEQITKRLSDGGAMFSTLTNSSR